MRRQNFADSVFFLRRICDKKKQNKANLAMYGKRPEV